MNGINDLSGQDKHAIAAQAEAFKAANNDPIALRARLAASESALAEAEAARRELHAALGLDDDYDMTWGTLLLNAKIQRGLLAIAEARAEAAERRLGQARLELEHGRARAGSFTDALRVINHALDALAAAEGDGGGAVPPGTQG